MAGKFLNIVLLKELEYKNCLSLEDVIGRVVEGSEPDTTGAECIITFE